MLAVVDGFEQEAPGGLHAADELDHDVDFRVVEDLLGVPGQGHVAELLGQPVDGDIGNPGQGEGGSRSFLKSGFLFEKRLCQAAADGAEADYPYFDVFHDVVRSLKLIW